MFLNQALEALKRKDFAAARDSVAREDASAFTLQHFLIKGLAELALQEWPQAAATFTAACERFPDQALLWLNRGVAEENLQQIDAATASMERCVALNPAQGEAYGNLSNLYRKARRFVEAEDMARRALDQGATRGDALNSLGLALGKQGKYAEADAAFTEARRCDPGNAEIIANHAGLSVDLRRFDQAWRDYAAARAIDDRAIFRRDQGMARLLCGDYGRGWQLYESRLDVPHALRVHPACPRWRGENLAGKKLLILAEQGFGDVIQFCRYAQFIPAAELVWAVPKLLARLLSGSVPGTVLYEGDDLPVCHYYVPVMSLPMMTEPASLAVNIPYLSAPDLPLLPAGKHKTKIGLVWAGSPTHERDHERSLKLAQLAPIFDSVDADFYAPFTGDALNQIGDTPVMRLDRLTGDFADTAALLKQMDCLISVDTAVAHLAGALGVPTFLLLSYVPDWRWGLTSETTSLYPSLTLLRQPAYGDWGSVIETLSELLKRRFRKPA